ncbi:MAG TPA: DRTGG domain-containing protein [Bacteroidales bacterium]|jgi:predicted transcriptional regulator|nr:serine kinase [Bacteroidales bacterium]NLK54736.1 serine kinase [Bacteroidales bacterium]HNY53754.1 DRTGG domain-containing protein [Bacteroidales bacterium]HOG57701.1 DRTGG domain-containing protein [Bacteroidales bacterium]HPB14056.1 DRTGG domain-containing protein [Bacteroidales bacterium]
MKITDVIRELGLKVLSGHEGLENEVTGAYVSDLLSDVIGNGREGNVWITLQGHHNIVAVASLKDLAAIIIVKGIQPDEETIRKSKQENIPLLSTEDDTFTVAGKLYNLILKQ